MASEGARFALYGMIIGGIVFAILFGSFYFSAARLTDEQKAEINNAYAQNCTKCLVAENLSCTADTLEYSSFGAICNLKYVSKNCTSCKRI